MDVLRFQRASCGNAANAKKQLGVPTAAKRHPHISFSWCNAIATPKIPARIRTTLQTITGREIAAPGGVSLIALKKFNEGAASPSIAPMTDAGARHQIEMLKYGVQACPSRQCGHTNFAKRPNLSNPPFSPWQ
jgi:hypothetical protein